MPDDYSADRFTTGTVAVGGSATGTIETAYDQDWFAVELVAGRTYRFDLEGSPTGRGTLPDTYLRAIYDSEGRYQSGSYNDNFDGSRNSRVTFTAQDSGTYYVRASGDRDEVGDYTLSVRDMAPPEADDPPPADPPPADPPADPAAVVAESETDQGQGVPGSVSEGAADLPNDNTTPGRVAVGGSATGTIGTARDNDRFAVELEAGRTYQFDLEGSPGGGGTLPDTYFRAIYNSEGRYQSGTYNDNFEGSRDSRVTFTAPESGTYYARVSGDRNETGTYTLTVTDMTAPETDGSSTNPVTPEAQEPTSEFVGPDETVPQESTSELDAQGQVVSQQPETSQAQGEPVSVSEGATDLPANTSTPGRVVVGGSATGSFRLGDPLDWFAVELEADKTYQFDLEGRWTSQGTLRDPYLRGIHRADGTRIDETTNDNGGIGYNSRVLFTPDTAATYYVAAGERQNRLVNPNPNSYTLSVADVTGDIAEDMVGPQDDYAAGTGITGTVAVGNSATGTIQNVDDRDWFAVELEAGKTYRIDLKGADVGAGTLYDPYLRGIYDADGTLIDGTTNNNGGGGRNSRVEFTPAAHGTYYVAAGADGDSPWGFYYSFVTGPFGAGGGTYTLSVTDVSDGPPDDYSADTETAGRVAVGGSVSGEIDYSGDGDWFAVDLEAGNLYRFDLKGLPTRHGTLADLYLRGIHDADGERIDDTTDDDGGAGLNSLVHFTPTEGATYYVAAGADGNGVGTYTLSVTEIPDDYAAEPDPATTGTVAVEGSARGNIDFSSDQDWFRVELVAGQTYQFDLEGSPNGRGTLRDPRLRAIYDSEGRKQSDSYNDDFGGSLNSRVYFTADASGAYYVAAGAGHRGYVGTYTLSVTDVTDDHVADPDTTGTVTVGGSVEGDIEAPGDEDWFAVELEVGKTYRFDLEGSATSGDTLYDPYLRGIHDADGERIDNTPDDDGGEGRNSRVFFTPDEDGTHYVAAGADGTHYGTYTLSVTEIPDDYAAEPDPDTTGTVAAGGSVVGDIEAPGDEDWFAVELEAGKTYRFDLKGSPTSDGTLADPYLRGIHDADGERLDDTTDDDDGAGRNSQVYFSPNEEATYYVAAGADGIHYGTYTLSVTELPDDYAADPATTGTAAAGGSVESDIEAPGDEDWFAVELEADKTYRFDLKGSSTSDGTLSDPYLRGIHDADGERIANTTDDDRGEGTNSRVYFTPNEGATYYVAAGAGSVGAGTYKLSVTDVTERLPDDYSAGTGTTGGVAAGGSATGKIDYSGDVDWFAVELEAGKTYRFDLEGSRTNGRPLHDPYLRGIHDADGEWIADSADDDGGEGYSSRVNFTPTENATFYVAAGAYSHWTGSYTLSVEEVVDGL